jgi:hypothetical protein
MNKETTEQRPTFESLEQRTLLSAFVQEQGAVLQLSAGEPFSGVVGTFDGSIIQAIQGGGMLEAKVQWGDHTHAFEPIYKTGPNGSYEIIANPHEYTHAGTYKITIEVFANGQSTYGVAQGEADVAAAVIVGNLLTSDFNQPIEGVLGTFDPGNIPINILKADIDWGDGIRSNGTIVRTFKGQYEVVGEHVYTQSGYHRINVYIDESSPENTMGTPILLNTNVGIELTSFQATAFVKDPLVFAPAVPA